MVKIKSFVDQKLFRSEAEAAEDPDLVEVREGSTGLPQLQLNLYG